MARVFTTFFAYEGLPFTAVVTQTNDKISFYIPNPSLHSIIPDGKATYIITQGIKIDQPRLSKAQHLVLSILLYMELPAHSCFSNTEAKPSFI